MNRYEVILLMNTGSQPMVKEEVIAHDLELDDFHAIFLDEYNGQIAWYPIRNTIVKLVEEDVDQSEIDDDNE
jgi:hypothetical protein